MRNQVVLLLALTSACSAPVSRTYYSDTGEKAKVIDENYIHKYGVEITPNEWQDRGSHGKRIVALSSGVTVAENYNFGRLDGEITYSFPYSSIIEKRANYKEGNWLSTEWLSEAGVPWKKEEPLSNNQKKVTEWYSSMAPKSIEKYEEEVLIEGQYFDPHQEKRAEVQFGKGERLRFSQGGILQVREKIDQGVVIERIDYWENGSPKIVTPLNLQGQIHGQKKSFLQDGAPDTFEEWKSGALNGLTTIFKGGEKSSEMPYINGKRQGVERRYLDGGRIVEEVTWINDAQATIPKRIKQD